MMLMSIAAMATDPATIALCGTIGGGILLKGTETVLSKRKVVAEVQVDPEEARIEGLAQAILEDDSFGGCTLEFQRAFEQKFIDAGIPTTLSKCYDERCETCHPKRQNLPNPAHTVTRKRIASCVICNKDVATSSRKGDVTCRACSRESAHRYLDRQKSMAAEKNRARQAYENSRSGKQRTAVVAGRMVPLPGNVPKRAVGEYFINNLHEDPYIVWTWTHEHLGDGDTTMRLRQDISNQLWNSLPLADNSLKTEYITADTINATPVFADPKNMKEYFKAQEYKMEQSKERILELEKAINKNILSIQEARRMHGTTSTGPQ